jgi:dipeptidyl aminopeptidase/acylaminoacyl peptidase
VFLPDGVHYAYLVGGIESQRRAFIGTLRGTDHRPLPGVTSAVTFDPSGHVLFLRGLALMVQRFDYQRLEPAGDPRPVLDPFASAGALAPPPASLSDTGTLVYTTSREARSQLTWFERTGKTVGVAAPAGEFGDIDLSPDGRYVSYEAGTPGDIWVLDLNTGVQSRLTSHETREADPVWSSDGKMVAFRADRDGGRLYGRAFGVVGEDVALLKGDRRDSPSSFSPDGQWLVFDRERDVFALPVMGDMTPIQLTSSPSRENDGRVSPDGRWLAYTSNESGRDEVYIQSFPKPRVLKQISNRGGRLARWSPDGKELYYVAPDNTLMASRIKEAGDTILADAGAALFPITSREPEGPYAVAPDGRFLVSVRQGQDETAQLTVILNWAAGLPK